MKITRLELQAYGAFSDVSTNFRHDAKVHVIIGPNEVGKSTRRAAIADFLYGFPKKSSFAFKHASPKLRIGASVLVRSEVHHLIRRKADKNSLQTANGTVVSADFLASILQGFDRAMFQKLCSISHEELAQGTAILFESEGAAAEALFGAASGGLHMRGLLQSFDDRIEALYAKHTSGKRPLNTAINEYLRFEKERIESTIDSAKWDTLNAAVRELDEHISAAQQSIATLDNAVRELDLFSELREQLEEFQKNALLLADLEANPLLSDDHCAELNDLQSQLDKLETQRNDLLIRQSSYQDANEQSDDHEAFIAAEADCQALVQLALTLRTLRAHATEVKLRDCVPDLAQEIQAEARSLWDGISLDEICAYTGQIGKDIFRKLRAEITAYQTSQADTQSCRNEIARIHEAIDEIKDAGPAEDPGAALSKLDAVLDEIETVGRVDQRTHALQEAISSDRSTLRQKLIALGLELDDPQDCRSLKLPARATIQRFEDDLDQNSRKRKELEEKVAEVELAIQTREQRIRDIAPQGRLVTKEILDDIRHDRDDTYTALFEDSAGRSATVAKSYEQLVQAADRTADERFDQAEQLGIVATNERELAEERRKLSTLSSNLVAIKIAHEQLQASWNDFSRPYIGENRFPEDLYPYLDEACACAELATKTAANLAELTKLRDMEMRLETDLRSCVEGGTSNLSFGSLLNFVRARQDTLRNISAESKANQIALKKNRKDLARHQDDLSTHTRTLESCKCNLESTLKALHIAHDVDLATASDIVDQLSELASSVSEYLEKRRKLTELETLEAQFARDAKELLQRCAASRLMAFAQNDLETIFELVSAMKSAHEERNARHGRLRQLESINAELTATLGGIETLKMQRDRLLENTVFHERDLPEVLARQKQRNEVKTKQLDVDQHIRVAARETPESILEKIAALGGQTMIALESVRLHKELEDENDRYQTLLQKKGVAVNERENARTSLGAVNAEAAAMTAAAEVDRLAREYAALVVARTLLADRAEVYADQNQGPIVKAASSYLKTMTLGRYTAIHIVEGSNGQPTLCVTDEGAQEKLVPEMSEGTQDQLYLALRLATIAQRLQNDAGPPLLLDDTLRTFDDDRTIAGFQALGAFSQHAQIFYFTPRTAVGDLAIRALGPGADIIYLAAEEKPLALF